MKYYLSPLSHKVVGVDVEEQKGKQGGDNNEVFIPCFPSPVPTNSINIDITYDIPPTNDYDDVKGILDALGNYDSVDCIVVDSVKKEKVGVILKKSKLFIPCYFDKGKGSSSSLPICTVSYDMNPYEFDKNLSKLDKADEARVTFNENLVQESDMYSKYRVETKRVLNYITIIDEEDSNKDTTKFLQARSDIVSSVMQYDEGESKKYKACLKKIRDALVTIYPEYVTTTEVAKVNITGPLSSDSDSNMEGGSAKVSGVESEDDVVFSSRIPQTLEQVNWEDSEEENEDNGKASSIMDEDDIMLEKELPRSSSSDEDIPSGMGIGILFSDSEEEKLYVSEKNLINKDIQNKELYTQKLADEILRYNRIKNFMLGPGSFIPQRIQQENLSKNEALYYNEEDYNNAANLTKDKIINTKNRLNTSF